MADAQNERQGGEASANQQPSGASIVTSGPAGLPRDSAGLILAGGRATRMQRGQYPPVDKGLVTLLGQPLISYVHAQMRPCVHTLYISANRNHDVYSGYGIVLTDDAVFQPDTGPLAGVATALRVSKEAAMYVWPVDVPFIPAGLFRLLREAAERAGSPLAYVSTKDGAHPLCLWLHRSAQSSLSKFLARGGRKVQHWLDDQGAVSVVVNPRGMELVNVNTPDELNRLQEKLLSM